MVDWAAADLSGLFQAAFRMIGTSKCLKFDTIGGGAADYLSSEGAEIIRRFPKEARIRMGRGLFRRQMGEQLGMPNSRPMPGVGAGVSELRVKGEDGSFRAFYYTASAQGVLVFHAFVTKTRRTPPLELELARKRLKELRNE